MPIRFLPQLEMAMAGVLTFIAAVGGVDDLAGGAIWDKTQFRIWSILGAFAGAFLTIAIFPAREHIGNYSKRLAIKFASSMVGGLVFTPIIMRWWKLPVDSDYVLAVSCGVAMVAVSAISLIVPMVLKKIGADAERTLNYPPEPPKAPTPINPPSDHTQSSPATKNETTRTDSR